MNKTQSQYKRDTGNAAFDSGIEPDEMIKSLEELWGSKLTARQILDYIRNKEIFFCVDIDNIPEAYIVDGNLILPSPDYIKWLEEK